MYCNKCGKQIEEDSIFCQYCGNRIVVDTPEPQSENNSQTKNVSNNATNKSKSDLLRDKFIEIYDAKDDEREKFNQLSSEYIWELIERLYTNAFEAFIQERKSDLNSQPYKVIEALKNLYLYSVLGGYRLWIAEALLNDNQLERFRPFDIDKFVEEWKANDFQKAMKSISDEMGVCMTMYLEHRMSSFLDAVPSAKELPNVFIEELRSSIIFQIVNGYIAGTVEAKFRK